MTAAEAREAGEAPATERPQPVAGARVETGSTAVTDPFAEPPAPNGRFLHALNPLAKLAAPLPAIVVLVVTRGLAIPTATLLLALAVLLVGARLRARTVVLLVVGLPLFVAVLGASNMYGPFGGFVFGYVLYDTIHWYVHAHAPRNRLGRWLRREHLVHHFKDSTSRFGVSCPWLDYVFGTRGQPHSARAAEDANVSDGVSAAG